MYKELLAYKKGYQLAMLVFKVSKRFPKEEKYSLTDQIRRSSRSIGAQIAESWAKRRYENHFIFKLTDADAEHYETKHWIEEAFDCDLAGKSDLDSVIKYCDLINQKLNSMISKASLFCSPNKK